MEIKDYNYVSIQGWMIKYIPVTTAELIIYALIHGYSSAGNQWCSVSYNYMAEFAKVTRRGAIKIVNSLTERGLIIKETYEDSATKSTYCRYKSVVPDAVDSEKITPVSELSSPGVVNSVHRGSEHSSLGVVNSVHSGSELSSPNNNIYNNINNNNIYIGDKSPETPARTSKKFVKPTVEEIREYCLSRNNNIDPQYFYDYYEGNDWKRGKTQIKNWQAAVRTWERNSYSDSGRFKQNTSGSCGDNKPQGFEALFRGE